jgi:hypothetical protein
MVRWMAKATNNLYFIKNILIFYIVSTESFNPDFLPPAIPLAFGSFFRFGRVDTTIAIGVAISK